MFLKQIFNNLFCDSFTKIFLRIGFEKFGWRRFWIFFSYKPVFFIFSFNFFNIQHTDICEHAIQALEHNKIKRVILLGRRGPLEVAFTIKELREMIRLDGTKPVLNPKDFVNVREQIPSIYSILNYFVRWKTETMWSYKVNFTIDIAKK